MGVLDVLAPLFLQNEIPAFKVSVGGAPLPDKYGVSSVTINNCVNKIPYAQLIILDGDVSTQKFEASDDALFLPGSEVSITMGTKNSPIPIFTGIIIKHSIKLLDGKPTMLIIEVKHKAVKLTIGRKNEFYQDKTDNFIIKRSLGEFAGDIRGADVKHTEMVQYFCTDWDFALTRAEANGLIAIVNKDKVDIVIPNPDKKPDISAIFTNNAYEFEAEIDARNDYSEVTASAYDDKTQKTNPKKSKPLPEGMDGKPKENVLSGVIGLSTYPLQHSGQLINDELQAWADAKLLRSRLSKVTGRVKIDGYKEIKPGDTIGIDHFSSRFNGIFFVSSVTHQLSAESAFYTDIQFGLSQEWFSKKYTDIAELPASGLLPPVYGLQVGIVQDIVDDNSKGYNDYRVKVSLPMVKAGSEGVWARLALLDAGKERGTFFFPEVNDEVILGFLNDDPRDAVILGSLYSKNANGAPPLQPEQANNKKGIYTRSKIKLEFDDEKSTVHIETPGGQKVHIDDKDDAQIVLEDKNKNKIEMTKDGISITSGKDLKISAKGDISIEGSKKISTRAKQNYTVEATGTIEIKTNSKNTIKGTPVELNP
jgi:Rhs element Vgr protein